MLREARATLLRNEGVIVCGEERWRNWMW
jgi:hypothetical protein